MQNLDDAHEVESPASARANALGATVAVVAALYIVFTTVRLVYRSYAPIPFWDQWAEAPGADRLAHLFAQHNEHRIAVSRVIFTLDDLLFHGRNQLNLGATLAFALCHAILLAELARRARPASRAAVALVYATALGLMLGAYQWENFVWGFQHQFVAVYAFATAAFASLALGRGRARALVAASIFATLATFTMSNGLQVPVLLVVLAVFLRRPRVEVAWLLVLACALVAFYMHDFAMPGQHGKPLEALRDPLRILRYVTTYIGAPFGAAGGSLATTQASGAVLLAANVALLIDACRRRDTLPRASIAMLGAAVFVLGTACLTALGRMSFGVEQALSSRYGTPALVLWASTILQLQLRCSRDLTGARAAVLMGTLAVLLLTARQQHTHYAGAMDRAASLRLAETALLARADDDHVFAAVAPDFETLSASATLMRGARTSIFADDAAALLGTSIATRLRIERGGCIGGLEDVMPAGSRTGSAFRVQGFAYLPKTRTRPDRVVIADAHGIIVGYAFTGTLRTDVVRAHAGIDNARTGFVGHVGRRWSRAGRLSAYALLDDRRACALPDTFDHGRVAPIFLGSDADLGAVVPMTHEPHGFTQAGFNRLIDERPAPEEVFGSFRPGAPFTGSYRATGVVPIGTERIAIFLIAGPHGDRDVNVRVRGLRDGATWGEISDFSAFDRWSLWLVRVPPHTAPSAFELIATDAGRATEAWIAVGRPHLAR